MQHYPKSIRELIRGLSKLPGIGEKTAERLAIHILRKPLSDAEALAHSIVTVKQKVRLCARCYGLSDDEQCDICRDASRDESLLCVVEQPADMIALEKSGAFRGLYHILGGTLAPMEGVGPGDLRLRELFERVKQHGVKEIILATGTSVEGESTAAYIAQQLAGQNVGLSRIASGVPVGGDLKYIDQMTLKCALDGRHAL
ncbi:MAG: recombination mediator RecR [Desulfatitalea sp.]